MASTQDEVREQVRARYAAAATAVATDNGCGCGTTSAAAVEACCAPAGDSGACRSAEALDQDAGTFGAGLYGADEQAALPAEAVAASLGCGNPLVVAIGHVEFRKGTIEQVPLPDGAVDVVISNCVINLSVDKPAVLAEMFRVLRPGGRVGVSDVVAEDQLTPAERAERGSYVGCIAGALSRGEYLAGLAAAGFTDASVTYTHEAAPGVHAAIVRATKPADPAVRASRAVTVEAAAVPAPVAAACCSADTHSSCCDSSAKSGCCGQTPAEAAGDGPPSTCGCH